MKLTTFRKTSQTVTFILFALLIVFTVYPFAEKLPVDFFLRLDPLVALVSMIGSWAIISTMLLSLILLILTLLFGRFFCGYICPLGTIIDFFNYILFKKPKKREKPGPKPNRNIKYFILIGVIAASLLGANVLHFFSPMSIVPRVFALIIFPPIIWFLNFVIDLIRPLSFILGLDSLAQFTFNRLYFANISFTFLLIFFIIVANYWRKRFWCRYICPTGALLSVFSRFGLLKRQTSSCDNCLLCNSKCDMRAIEADGEKTILSECTLCGNCIDACKKNYVTIGLTQFGFGTHNAALQIDRRKFIYSAVTGIVSASAIKAGLHNNRNIDGRFLRPPGSIPEDDFLSRCIRCGECMKVCKTNGIQPTGLSSGLDTLWTPAFIPRQGACEDKCNMCGHVCPTQAIRALPLPEKMFVKIGTAVIDRHRCIAWEQNKLCLICDEICPYDAIEFKIITTFTGPFKRPFVLEDKCTGCGWCEHKCPVFGRAAIEVYSIGEDRIHTGSYISEKRKKLREITENEETSYDVNTLGSGGENLKTQPAPQKTKESQDNEPLPGGFIMDE